MSSRNASLDIWSLGLSVSLCRKQHLAISLFLLVHFKALLIHGPSVYSCGPFDTSLLSRRLELLLNSIMNFNLYPKVKLQRKTYDYSLEMSIYSGGFPLSPIHPSINHQCLSTKCPCPLSHYVIKNAFLQMGHQPPEPSSSLNCAFGEFLLLFASDSLCQHFAD